jgi:hypothetical protein
MATYTLPINSLFTESGDDIYAKPLDGNFTGSNWPDDSVSAIEVADTNVYEIELDETKGYVFYLNGHTQSFVANAGTDVITANDHGLVNGQTVRFKGLDLPAPLVQVTVYFVRDVTTHTFKVAATSSETAIDLTDAGTGTMTFTTPSERSKAGDTKIGTVAQIRDSQLAAEGEDLQAIKEKTDLIGTGAAIVSAPVSGDGDLLFLIIGDDYLASNNRALEWSFDAIVDFTTSAVGKLGMVNSENATETYLNSTGVVSEISAGVWKVSFDIPATALTSLTPGYYDWSVSIEEDSVAVTIVRNRQNKTRVKLIEKQT